MGINRYYIQDYIFMVLDLVPSELTRFWNQDPPLELAEPELINRGEIRVWVESGTGNVAMGEEARQMFVVRTILEEWLEAVAKCCNWHLGVKLSAVKM